ncbi:MAG: ornithine cyclodeaminase family protein [Rhodospirillales bacterium]|nr:ornithine cyclodeaminase family protein [Rhodospirillales bacterium]
MARVDFRFLNRAEVRSLLPPTGALLEIVASGLAAHGRREVVLPPKAHIQLDDRYNGHFNILVGWAGPVDTAGVKVVGDYVENYRHGLPSEVAMLTLYNPRTGAPKALMDATDLTTARTGAVTGIGAKHLAPPEPKIVGHVGARGTAYANLAALAELYDLDEIRITSKRTATREELARRVETTLGVKARAVATTEEAVRGADIVVEATRLERPDILIRDEWLKPNVLLVTYGWIMAVDPKTVRAADKIVVDDWEQCRKGGQLFPMIESGELTRAKVHAEIGEIVAGRKPGRTAPGERIVYWHRGFAISDIMLGAHVLRRAEEEKIGQIMTLFDQEDE